MSSLIHEERKSMRLINSINDLPYWGGRPEEAFIVSGTAMKQITEELQKLWHLRETLAEAVRTVQMEKHKR